MPRGDVDHPALGAVAFNQPMVPVSAVDEPAAATQVHFTPPVALTARWMGTTTLGFWPETPLKGSTTYTVEVGSLRAVSGQVTRPHRWTFRTAAAQVVASAPPRDGQEVPVASPIYLNFDQPVDAASLQALAHLESGQLPMPGVHAHAATDAEAKQYWEQIGQTGPGHRSSYGVPDDDKAASDLHVIVLVPDKPLPDDTRVTLIVAPGVRSLEGPEPSRAAYRLDFATLGKLRVVSAGCDQALCDPDRWQAAHVNFNNTLPNMHPWQGAGTDKNLALPFFKITPPVPGLDVRCYGSSCALSAEPKNLPDTTTRRMAWQAETTYTVEVLPTITDVHGQKLGTPYTGQFTFGHRQPLLDVLVEGEVFERDQGPHRMALLVRNMTQLGARAMPMTRSNVVKVLQALHAPADDPDDPASAAAAKLPATALDFSIPLAVAPTQLVDQDERRVIELDPALGGVGKAGAFVLDIMGKGGTDTTLPGPKVYRVTDLHVLAKAAQGTSVFWVTSYKTGKPVAGVALSVVTGDGQEAWRGTTNADGLATGPTGLQPPRAANWSDDDEFSRDSGPAKPPEPLHLLLAAKGDDWTFLELDNGRDIGDSWSWSGDPCAGRGLLFTDKILFKQGETVQFKGIVRNIGAAGIALVKAGAPVALEVIDPRGRSVGKIATTVSENGSFDGSWPLPLGSAYGDYQLRAMAGDIALQSSFGLREYRTPKFTMQVTADQKHYVTGDPIAVSAHASYYSGGPLAGAAATLDVSGSATTFAPPGWPAFAFGDSGSSLLYGASNRFAHKADHELTDEGKLAVLVPTAGSVAQESIPLDIEVTASDPNGQTVSHTTQAWLHPSAVHGGIGAKSLLVQVGEPIVFQLLATDHIGKPVAGAKLTARVVRREFLQVREVGIGGVLQYRTETKDTDIGGCSHSSGIAAVTCSVVAAAPGQHHIALTAADSAGRLSRANTVVYVVGKGQANWEAGERSDETLVPDQKTYKIGEKAHILVKNVTPGATALVTEERDGVLRTRMVKLDDTAPALDIPIEARHAPNFYVGIAIFGGRSLPASTTNADIGAPTLKVAYTKIVVSVDERQLAVKIAPAKLEYRPGDEVVVALTVADGTGKPRAGEVALWAVDEGVIALSGQVRPDPMGALYAPVALGVRNLAQISELIKGKVGEEKGEDGGSGATLRGNFKDVAVWLPKVMVDGQGKATAQFKLPDNLTAFRLMAVAVAGPEAMGSAETTIRVDKPLMLLTTWPKKVHVGDEFEIALTVRNRSKAGMNGVGTAAIDQKTGGCVLVGSGQTPFSLKPNLSGEMRFRARATRPGLVQVQVRATAGAEQDGVTESVEIVDPAPTESVATWGQTEQRVQEALAKSPSARPGIGGVQIAVATTPLAGLRGSLDWLMRYPYGCTEQLASQLQAFLWTERLAQHYDVLPDQRKLGRERAQQTIAKILQNRVGTQGAFSLWPSGEQPDIHATAWALRLLHEAKAAGMVVDDALLKDGAAFLREQLSAAPQTKPRGDDEPQVREELHASIRAQIVATLSAMGQPAAGDIDALFAQRATLSPDDQLLVAEAAAGAGPSGVAEAKTVLDELTRTLHMDAATAHWAGSDGLDSDWGSPVRTNALLLHLMMLVAPDHPLAPRVARWLLDQRTEDRWGSTQDNAWALRGLGAWMQGLDSATGDQQVQVLLGDKPVGGGTLKNRSIDPLVVQLADSALPSGLVPVVLSKQGPGLLHYSIRYTYALQAQAEVARNAGLFVQRKVIDESGERAATDIARGTSLLVAVVVVCDRDRRNVVVVDQLPAGLEPTDFALRTSSAAAQSKITDLTARLVGSGGTADRSVNDADHHELAGREVRWFVDNLSAGAHIYTYAAQAAVRGQYLGRGARAEAMYAPEVFGSSGPNHLTIH